MHELSEVLLCCLTHFCAGRSDGVVVITSALHAEGREFDPRSDLHFVHAIQFPRLSFHVANPL